VKNTCSGSGGALRENERVGMKLSLLPKLLEKLVWVLDIWLCKKYSFPVTYLMAYYAEKKLAILSP